MNLSYMILSRTGYRLRKHAANASGGEAGGAMVEMALVLPLMLIVVTGIFTFGIALNNYLVMTDAVSIGARSLAISRSQATDPCATTVTAVEHAAPYLKPANLNFSFVLNGTAYSGTSCPSGTANLVQGQPVQVTITYPCNLAIYGKNYAPSCLLSAQTTELTQ